jgi:hypothetical protein
MSRRSGPAAFVFPMITTSVGLLTQVYPVFLWLHTSQDMTPVASQNIIKNNFINHTVI